MPRPEDSEPVRSFRHDERGATAMEYFILIVLILCFALALFRSFQRPTHRPAPEPGENASESTDASPDATRF